MMPEYLEGDEFQYVDPAENIIWESPSAIITSIVANYKEHFASFVKIDDYWVYFSDETIRQVASFEDVIQTLLNESLFPLFLIYKTDNYKEVREDRKDTSQMLKEYYEIAAVKKGKLPQFIDANETESENNITGARITEDYRKRSIRGSLISQDSKRKKKTKIVGAKCCF